LTRASSSSVGSAGAPAEPTDELLALVKKHATRVPSAAALFGITAPAPADRRSSRPRPKAAPPKASHPPLPPGPSGERRIPPPPRPSAPAEPVQSAEPTEATEVALPVEQPALVRDAAPDAEAPVAVEELSPATSAED